jgi:NAD(P)-dependent dehydrogenase (short-subunit alcohol dehydrogenase family)
VKKGKGKKLLITGGASGIGAATARLAAERGHRVMIADINTRGVRAVARSIGDRALPASLDITSARQWKRVLDHAWAKLGGLDVLVNNAAIVRTGYARDVSIADHQQTLDVNYMGALKGMLAVLPRFKAQGSGHLLTVCSMTAFLPFPGIASYAAAKHALRAFHHALALEERHGPLKFTIVHPTSTETPMLEQEARDDALALAFAVPTVTAQHVASVIVDALDSDAVEVFMPPSRARAVRMVGTNPRALRKLVEQNEIIGAKNLRARRGIALRGT